MGLETGRKPFNKNRAPLRALLVASLLTVGCVQHRDATPTTFQTLGPNTKSETPSESLSAKTSPEFAQREMVSLLKRTLNPKLIPPDTAMPIMSQVDSPPSNPNIVVHEVISLQKGEESLFLLSVLLVYNESKDPRKPTAIGISVVIPETHNNLTPNQALDLWKNFFRVVPTIPFKCSETPRNTTLTDACQANSYDFVSRQSFRIQTPPTENLASSLFQRGTQLTYAVNFT